MPATPLTRFERAERNKDAILDAAATVFAKRGFAGASIQEFLDLAGATKGGMYYHWQTKLDVATELLTRGAPRWQELLSGLAVGSRGLGALSELWHGVAGALEADVKLLAFVRIFDEIESGASSPLTLLRDQMVTRLQQALVDGEVDERINMARTSTVLIDAMCGVLFTPAPWGREAETAERLDRLWSLLGIGVSAS